MPLNSYKCPKCGKRNNYSVQLDSNGDQVVQCAICKYEQVISYDQLPERVQTDLDHKQEIERTFSHNGEFFKNLADRQKVDTLSVMEQHFQETQDDLNSFVQDVSVDTNMQAIIQQYVPDMGTDTILDEVSSKVINDNGDLSSNWKRDTADIALSQISNLLSDGSMSERIVLYIQQVLQSGRGLEALEDTELMKSAGLGKKERFLLKQAAKNDQITAIISQAFGGGNI